MAPTIAERRNIPGAKVIVLETSATQAKLNATKAKRPRLWSQYIDDWWNSYEPDARDIVIHSDAL